MRLIIVNEKYHPLLPLLPLLFLSSFILLTKIKIAIAFETSVQEEEGFSYGVDISWPIHHETVSSNYPWLFHNVGLEKLGPPTEYVDMPFQPLGDRQKFYDDMMEGCRSHHGEKGFMCDESERNRIKMNLSQPRSMQNYTEMGFKKIRAPDKVWKLIQQFWKKNKDNGTPEVWDDGNSYVNFWSSPTDMISVEEKRLRGGGNILEKTIWDATKNALQEWTGEKLTPSSLYGIRVYKDGAILAPHVDRLPLVSSAVMNVAQDVDEDWPMEVYGHDGRAYNVTLKPGEMILYESHSVLHGRPYPLKGRYYANVFIHFEPMGHSLRHDAKMDDGDVDIHAKYKEVVEKGVGGHEHSHDGLPPYIIRGSTSAETWSETHSEKWEPEETEEIGTTGSTTAHHAASNGDLDLLEEVSTTGSRHLDKEDSNGWRPIHEAGRGGHLDIIQFLVENAVDINAQTRNEKATALWYAEESHGESHPVTIFLRQLGALSVGPEF